MGDYDIIRVRKTSGQVTSCLRKDLAIYTQKGWEVVGETPATSPVPPAPPAPVVPLDEDDEDEDDGDE